MLGFTIQTAGKAGARRSSMSTSASSIQRRCKSVVVTGGAQGLGEAICRRLADDGYDVTVADVQKDKGQELATEINGSFLEVDVTDPDQVKEAIREVVQQNNEGCLDALVNNAGIVGFQTPFGEYDIDEWKRVIDVNLNGTFYGLKYGLQQMATQEKGGSIVNMSSIVGCRGLQHLAPYVASKWAVRGMTQAAAVEYGSKNNIRVNALAPTGCETPMAMGFVESAPDPELMRNTMTAMNVLPGFPQPSDVAAACAFLLSDDARYITGHTLPVDAGALSRIANAPETTIID